MNKLENSVLYSIIRVTLLLFLYSTISAQYENQFEKFTIKDGLSNNDLWDVEQDQNGFLWIASQDGLNFYDGYSFKVYKNSPDDSTSLPDNVCNNVFVDSENNLWIGTKSGLVLFNRLTETFSNYQFSDGNSENANSVWNIVEDAQKDLWIATTNGVLSFDKVNKVFKNYDLMKIDNSVAPFINNVGSILFTKNNELYAGSVSYGIVKFNYSSQIFVQMEMIGDYPKPNNVFTSIVDHDGNIWLGTILGLYKYNPNNKQVQDITPFKKAARNLAASKNGIYGLYEDRNLNMWIGTSAHGIILYDSETQNFKTIYDDKVTNYIGPFYEDSFGIIWCASFRGLMKYDLDKKPFEIVALADEEEANNEKFVIAFAESNSEKNKLWLGTPSGVFLYDIESQLVNPASGILRKSNAKSSNSITTIIEDDNYLWYGTQSFGLFKLNLNNNNSINFRNRLYDDTTIDQDQVNTLLDMNDKLWLGTNFGINVLNKETNQISRIPSLFSRQYNSKILNTLEFLKNNETPLVEIQKVGDYADISKDFVLTEDKKALIVSVGEGLFQWNMVDYGWLENEAGDTLWKSNDLYKTYHAGGNGKNREQIGILELKKGRYKLNYLTDDSHSVKSFNAPPPQDTLFWGISLFELKESQYDDLDQLVKKDDETTYTDSPRIWKLIKDSKGMVWAATGLGLSKIDPENYSVINFRKEQGRDGWLSSELVNDLIEDAQNNVWIATEKGLNLFNESTNKFILFGEKNGLPTNTIKSVNIDDNGDLWIGTTMGISKLEISENYENPIIINYDVKDGLQGYEFLAKASFKDAYGKLYFSGLEGFNVFLPRKSNTSLPFVALKNIMISNKSISSIDPDLLNNTSINQLDELNLSHDKNDLSFEFVSIHYARPDKNRLLYKMVGVDEDWILSNRRFATYTNMSSGEYVFNIKGSNGDGIWSDRIKQLKINISPPWYNNWTAYSVYAVLFFGLLYGVRKFEMGRQQKNIFIKESRLKIEKAEAVAKAAESDKRALQIEFEHKKKELEEARELQLSMLPRDLPQLPHLDIAVYMKTATEVGGDYYDFHIGLDGTLTVVVGDATGHGMKAGTMVTTTKSLFNVLAPNPSIVETFHEMTRCLKLMHMQKLSMCMTMLKIKENAVQMSSAGMPPVFIYKRDNQVMEEHVIKGMPLGTFNEFPYSIVESKLGSGDAILLTSDGFPELVNSENETFGYKRVRNLFEEVAGESPEEIITKLKNAGSHWVKDADPDDDVTFVVIKIK